MALVSKSLFKGIDPVNAAVSIALTGFPMMKDMKENGVAKGFAQNIPSIAFMALNTNIYTAIGYSVAQATVGMFWENAKAQGDAMKEMKYTGSGYVGSGHFNMSDAGYTMRQRAMEKMQGTAVNINQVFGNEARNYVGASRARGSVI